MSIILYKAKAAWRSVKPIFLCIMFRQARVKAKHSPCVSVKTHDDSFDATAIFWASTFCEKLIYLLFRCIETQVTNLEFKTFGCRQPEVRRGEGVPT